MSDCGRIAPPFLTLELDMNAQRQRKTYENWVKSIYFSAYPPPTLMLLSHRFTRSIKSF
jgi:hypothetical protein